MEEAKMSNQKPSEDSSRRNFLSAAAVVASAAVAAPTAANAQTQPSKKPGPNGIRRKRKNGVEITTPDFQLAPDAIPGIAQVIVNLWLNKPLRDQVLLRDAQGFATQAAVVTATTAINAAAPNYNFTR